MSLKDTIQKKKESEDYISLKMGLHTEMQCFEAIEMLGAKKFQIKAGISKMLDQHIDPNSKIMKDTIAEAQQIHYLQASVVNDVCSRFEVIHPQMDEKLITPELLNSKQRYWDWYKSMYKKKYGKEPEIIEK